MATGPDGPGVRIEHRCSGRGRLRQALARALVPFYPLAGRMATGPEGRLEIDCNGEGALFVVARADFTGDEMFRDFEPSPEARRLLVPFAASGDPPCLLAMVQWSLIGEKDYLSSWLLRGISASAGARMAVRDHCDLDYTTEPNLFFWLAVRECTVARTGRLTDCRPVNSQSTGEVTFLKCGGVAVGTGMHHVTMDGAGAIQFIRTWTTLARGLDAASVHPSPPVHDRTVLRARSPPHATFEHPVYSPSNLNGLPRPFVTRVYAVSPKLLAGIKSSCAPGVSTYCALTAHLWRAMCVARGLAPDAESRLRVPATSGSACARSCRPITSATPLVESEKGSQAARGQFMPETDLWVVSWLGMPIHDADFGWGCPKFVAPAQMFGSGTAYVTQAPDKDDGVSVLFALEPEYLQCFEKAFYGE
uniref:Anthranilate N-benzoyltransferase protein 1 n=1 Tax=Aegilops tauschii TaxID=37682 RepID=M8BWW1_AEGTA